MPDAFSPPPPLVEPSPRWVRVRAGGTEVANSRRALLVCWYGPDRLPTYCFPAEDVRTEFLMPSGTASADGVRVNHDALVPSDTATRCPYKGTAAYWSVQVGGTLHPDIAWHYDDPIPENPRIKGLVAFFNERVDLTVDGVRQDRPLTPWSR
ncbi:MAG: DUF427 domain-containing protein [Acidimicrobiales bacterium]